MPYDFSLVRNNGRLFPELRVGDVIVFGDHPRAFAKCDYDGNMNRPYPGNKPTNNLWLPLARDPDSVMAWHGERKREGHVELVQVDWTKALNKREKDQKWRDRKNDRGSDRGSDR